MFSQVVLSVSGSDDYFISFLYLDTGAINVHQLVTPVRFPDSPHLHSVLSGALFLSPLSHSLFLPSHSFLIWRIQKLFWETIVAVVLVCCVQFGLLSSFRVLYPDITAGCNPFASWLVIILLVFRVLCASHSTLVFCLLMPHHMMVCDHCLSSWSKSS